MTEIIPCDKLTLALAVSALVCCSNSFADIENSNARTGDEAPPAVKRLVPGGWKLEYFAIGPLTDKNRKDVVMSIAKKPEGAFGNAEARRLIVASKSGTVYKIVASGDHALQLGLGPAGSDPFVATAKKSNCY